MRYPSCAASSRYWHITRAAAIHDLSGSLDGAMLYQRNSRTKAASNGVRAGTVGSAPSNIASAEDYRLEPVEAARIGVSAGDRWPDDCAVGPELGFEIPCHQKRQDEGLDRCRFIHAIFRKPQARPLQEIHGEPFGWDRLHGIGRGGGVGNLVKAGCDGAGHAGPWVMEVPRDDVDGRPTGRFSQLNCVQVDHVVGIDRPDPLAGRAVQPCISCRAGPAVLTFDDDDRAFRASLEFSKYDNGASVEPSSTKINSTSSSGRTREARRAAAGISPPNCGMGR